jgi:phosphate transport system permease protein
MIFAFPVGVLAAIYMNEYVSEGPKKIIKQMTNNLAGVPSIVFGLFGMALFVNKLGFETRSLPVD